MFCSRFAAQLFQNGLAEQKNKKTQMLFKNSLQETESVDYSVCLSFCPSVCLSVRQYVTQNESMNGIRLANSEQAYNSVIQSLSQTVSQ